MSIGKNIRDLRRRRGRTQQQLAAAMGSCQSHVSGLESDHGNPRIDTLRRAAVALGVSLERLVEE